MKRTKPKPKPKTRRPSSRRRSPALGTSPLPSGPPLPGEMALFPLRGSVVFPSTATPLIVGRPRALRLLDEQVAAGNPIAVVAQRDEKADDPGPADLFGVATACRVGRLVRLSNGSAHIVAEGLRRVRIVKILRTEPYVVARVEPIDDQVRDNARTVALARSVAQLFQKLVALESGQEGAAPDLLQQAEPAQLSDIVAASIEMPFTERQALLETSDVEIRLQKLLDILGREVEVLEISGQIRKKAEHQLDQQSRQMVLREQMAAIRKELGEVDDGAVLARQIGERITAAQMPAEVESAARQELKRLESMSAGAAEYGMVRTYLEWLVALPWAVATPDQLDIASARRALDEDHCGLDEVKERILESLAVMKLRQGQKGMIICFVGPPGVGKTSLGRSIARATGRKFVRASLGGVHDEAEIRGHRRTYVGAMPGRIIQGLRTAGANNPVFMLDEIDKLGTDFRGDPASALLEVLDPAQNASFADHYLDVPFDLSRVMFIATANVLDTVPPALRDRMEVITVPGYTEEEKLDIARRHLLPKQIEAHGLPPGQLTIDDEAIRGVVHDYTQESGVRDLDRQLATICRKVARRFAESPGSPTVVQADDVRGFLGSKRVFHDLAEPTFEPGVATGLAWTPAGGQIMFIEATRMKGAPATVLTGQLGDVMKESARIAISWLRSHAADLQIPDQVFAESEIHIHVPAGAVPKDGPSAGVALATALASLFTGVPVRADLAMTGELTLRGRVLPVGGIKEKVLAAKRAGIRALILPVANQDDLEKIPPALLQDVDVRYVRTIDEALAIALDRSAIKAATVAAVRGPDAAPAGGPQAAVST